jgi:hypothetical protein
MLALSKDITAVQRFHGHGSIMITGSMRNQWLPFVAIHDGER